MKASRRSTGWRARCAGFLALCLGAALAGCVGPGGVGPASAVSRGRALLDAGDYQEARHAFRAALSVRPDLRQAQLGLAASFEATGDYDSARAIYDTLSTARLPRSVRRQLQARLHLVARRAREQAARQALANESALTAEPPMPNTFAVMPFQYLGSDSTYQPLERGLAQLLVTDLGRISAITVLERERIQQILDEIRLSQQGATDSTAAVRSGRLLRAGQIVQGSMFDLPGREGVQVDASVVNTATADLAATSSASDRLEELFALEKTILFQLIDRLQIPVTLAEQQAMAERPTTNLLAFFAFSRGLVFEDQGRFAEATAEYGSAARLDPAFSQAQAAAERTSSIQSAEGAALSGITRLMDPMRLETSFIAENLNRVMPSGMENVDRAQTARETTPPGQRDPLGDVGGNDQVHPPAGFGIIEIRVRRP